jgi:hypothetical protein
MLLHHHLETVAPRIRDRRPELPGVIDSAIARCLEKDPNLRFQGAADLARVLERMPSYGGVRYFDEAWKTQVAAQQHELDPIDIEASSDALVHAVAEALLAQTQGPALERALSTISTLEIALDAIDAEIVALEQDHESATDEVARESLTERAIVMAARKAEQEDAIASQLAALRGLVDELASQTEDRSVHALLARERGLRPMRRN